MAHIKSGAQIALFFNKFPTFFLKTVDKQRVFLYNLNYLLWKDLYLKTINHKKISNDFLSVNERNCGFSHRQNTIFCVCKKDCKIRKKIFKNPEKSLDLKMALWYYK